MAAVTISEMLDAEAAAMASGWSEEGLLNLAGENLAISISRYFPSPGTIIGYLGKGHNAGDVCVALRLLRDCFGWVIDVRMGYPVEACAPLLRRKLEELGGTAPLNPAYANRPLVLLDGLVGSGISGELRKPLARLAEEMHTLRHTLGARIAAVDLPSGIDPDSGAVFPNTVRADVTFMIGNPKRGLLHGHAAVATGALVLVEVPPLTRSGTGDLRLVSPQTLACGKGPRPFDFHKGMAGRVAILAGSERYAGAAVLAATGALRGGGGLITLFTPPRARSLIAAKCPPEIILREFGDPRELLEDRFDSLVVGCGLVADDPSLAHLVDLILESPTPVVIDAGALDIVAASGKMSRLTERHVLTPHPGEFSRLAPELADLPREVAARELGKKILATLLLKGSRTLVTRAGQPVWCNSTGSPGMATGGQGDLLAGVIGARLAIGDSPLHAAAFSAWLCGRSAEVALLERHLSEESLTPGDVLHFLGAAFKDWKNGYR